jgi:hypothetical protein
MKLKNNNIGGNVGFFVFSLILFTVGMAVLIVSLVDKQKNVRTSGELVKPKASIVIKEEKLVDGFLYLLFEDVTTKSRIFYYRDSMVVLPREGIDEKIN